MIVLKVRSSYISHVNMKKLWKNVLLKQSCMHIDFYDTLISIDFNNSLQNNNNNNANQNTFDITIENMNMNMVGGRRRRQLLDNQLSKSWCKLAKLAPNNMENVILQRFLIFSMAEAMDLTGNQTIQILQSCHND